MYTILLQTSCLFKCVDEQLTDTTPSTSEALKTEEDEQLSRIILYEDLNEYLFTLNTNESRIYLLSQFIDFYGGKMSQL